MDQLPGRDLVRALGNLEKKIPPPPDLSRLDPKRIIRIGPRAQGFMIPDRRSIAERLKTARSVEELEFIMAQAREYTVKSKVLKRWAVEAENTLKRLAR